MKMKKGKSPGSNGFTADFFKHFWKILGIFLYRAFLESVQNGTTLHTHRESIVTLILKPGKSADSLKGWRPISLLNVDFKILSAAVANRLKLVSDSLISPSQTAYINGRYIGENSRIVYDVIEHLNHTNNTGIIMAVDYESAFDTLSWKFLLEALDYYNFGFCWKHIIKTFYLNDHNFSRILLDGYLGPKINMNRGIRQGDPSSGYLFNLVMEPLANQLIHSAHIKGIQLVPNFEARVSQYADDLIVFSSPNESSIKGVLHELKEFQKVNGLHVNVEKTKCLLVGRLVTMESFNNLSLSFVDELKILGIRFNRDNNQITSHNLAPLLPILTVEAAQWRRRNLSLMGKITVIKLLLLSKLVHILTALPNPSDEDIKKIITYSTNSFGTMGLIKYKEPE